MNRTAEKDREFGYRLFSPYRPEGDAKEIFRKQVVGVLPSPVDERMTSRISDNENVF